MNARIVKAVLARMHQYQKYAESVSGMKVPMWVDFADERGEFPAAPEGSEDDAWGASFEIVGKSVRMINMTDISNPIIHWMNGVPVAKCDAVFYTPRSFRPSPGISLEL